MRFEIFAPKKMGIRDGRLRKAVIWAESSEEESQLAGVIARMSADGWPQTGAPPKRAQPPKCGCDEYPECTHMLYWYEGFKAARTEIADGDNASEGT